MYQEDPSQARAYVLGGVQTATLVIVPLSAVVAFGLQRSFTPETWCLAGGALGILAVLLFAAGYRRTAAEYLPMPASGAAAPPDDEPDEAHVKVLGDPMVEGAAVQDAPHLMVLRTARGWQPIEEPVEAATTLDPEPHGGVDGDGDVWPEDWRALATELLNDPIQCTVKLVATPLPKAQARDLAPEIRKFLKWYGRVTVGATELGREFFVPCPFDDRRWVISGPLGFGEVYTIEPGREEITILSADTEPTPGGDHISIWQLICDLAGLADEGRG